MNFTVTQSSRSIGQIIGDAVKLYFEPLTWAYRKLFPRVILKSGTSKTSELDALLRSMHETFLPTMKRAAIELEDGHDIVATGAIFQSLCQASRDHMAMLTRVPANHMDCSIRMIKPDEDDEDASLIIINTSKVRLSRRPSKLEPEDFTYLLIEKKTRCFSCGDLKKVYPDWPEKPPFRSTVAFPIRVRIGIEDITFGCISFESSQRDAFKGMPDFADYRGELDKYESLLPGIATFNLGAFFADTLCLALRPSLMRLRPSKPRRGSPEIN